MEHTVNFRKLNIALASCCVFFSAAVLAAPPAAPSGKRWVPVNELSDDFNFFDSQKWQKRHATGWAGRKPSVFNSNNAAVSGGMLRLNMSVKDSSQRGDWIWAGVVSSNAKSFTKGMYSEVRTKAANLSGTSSFWMQGRYSEIDVIENYGNVTNDRWRHLDTSMESNTHYFRDGWNNDKTTHKNWRNPNNMRNADNFYTYGVWWKDSRTIIYYRDGVELGRVSPVANFDEPMHVFLDMEVFDWGPGFPTLTQLWDNGKNTAYYDFIKTYRLQ